MVILEVACEPIRRYLRCASQAAAPPLGHGAVYQVRLCSRAAECEWDAEAALSLPLGQAVRPRTGSSLWLVLVSVLAARCRHTPTPPCPSTAAPSLS